LDKLAPAEQDRLLTKPFYSFQVSHHGPCMVQVAQRVKCAGMALCRGWDNGDGPLWLGTPGETDRGAYGRTPGFRYEFLCERFGQDRINVLIRARLMRTRGRQLHALATAGRETVR
jgi:hypothetical protein